MKTKIIQNSLLVIFALLSLNVSAFSTGIIKNKKVITLTSFASELKEAELHIESWMIELKEFRHNTSSVTDEEVQIEDWMTVEFSGTMENKNFLDQEINLEDWMTKSFDFCKEENIVEIEPEIEPWMCEIM